MFMLIEKDYPLRKGLAIVMISHKLQHEQYALWEVIEFGDSYEVPKNDAATGSASEGTATKKGRTIAVTTEDMQKRRNDAAILNTFGGNEAIKKTKKNLLKQQYGNFKAEGSETLEQTFNKLRVIVSQLEFMDIDIEQDDLNQKFLTSLAPEWLMHTIVWTNRSDLDTMSLDDLYNHLKSGNEEVNTTDIPIISNQVSPAGFNVATASISLDTGSAYIASQSNGSQIKYEDINQIDEDDIEEMNIKWNMALLSMRANRYWKKTWKKISIQDTDVAGFDKSKVKCFNCHKMGHFARECRAPRSQDKGRRDNYRQWSKVEEQAPKALMAINEVGCDWIFMANEEENHALVADEESPTEFTLMAKSNTDNEVFDHSLCSKACKKNTDSLNSKFIELSEKLGDTKNMLYHYKLDDTITDYSRPSPAIESNSDDLQNRNPSVTETEASSSSILSKPAIKFVKATERPTKNKTDKVETIKKPIVQYAKLYRKTSKKSNFGENDGGGGKLDGKGYESMYSMIKTTDEGTKILATVDSKLRIISESSIRRYLKLKDEPGISSLPDAKLFENLTLMGYHILPNQKFSFQKGQLSHQWKYLIHTIMQCLSPKSTGFNEFSSNIATDLVCLVTNRVYNFSIMIFDGMVRNVNNKVSKFLMYPRTVLLFPSMLVTMGEGSGTPTKPYHTPSPEAQQTSPTATLSPSFPPVTTATIPTVIPSDTPQIRQYTKRARIAQSSALLPVADEPASLIGDNSSMQQKLNELTDLCTRLQRQQDELALKITAQDLEIATLKARIKHLEDRDGGDDDPFREDTTIKGRRLETEKEAGRFNLRRTSLTGFPAQSIRSSNAIALDSPYLLVLITRTSQSRQHGNE
nr:hypothetical protein [Tanacetum cinerariifolium]